MKSLFDWTRIAFLNYSYSVWREQIMSLFLSIHRAPDGCWSNCVSVPCNSYSAWHVLIKLNHFSLQFMQLLACADQTESLFFAIHTAPDMCWSNWVSVPCNSYSAWLVLIKLSLSSLQFIQRLACAVQTESLFLAIHTAPGMCWSNWVTFLCNSYSSWHVLIKLSLCSSQFIQRLACADQTESQFLAIHTADPTASLYSTWHTACAVQTESLFLAIHTAPGMCWSN